MARIINRENPILLRGFSLELIRRVRKTAESVVNEAQSTGNLIGVPSEVLDDIATAAGRALRKHWKQTPEARLEQINEVADKSQVAEA